MSHTTRVFRCFAVPALLCALALAANAQDTPSITGPLQQNADIVRGTAGGSNAVSIWVNLKQAGQSQPSGGKFAVPLDTPLKSGDLVEARQTTDGMLLESAPLTVQGNGDEDSVTLFATKEGDMSVSGKFEGADITDVTVEILQGDQILQSVAATVDIKQQQFTATLKTGLAEDESIHIHGENTNGKTVASTYSTVDQLGFDWGRVRVYFSLGAEWARNNTTATASANDASASSTATTTVGTFASPTAFVGMNIDYNWWNSAKASRCISLSKQELANKTFVDGFLQKRQDLQTALGRVAAVASVDLTPCQPQAKSMFLLNTYFDARLTDIPISNSQTSSNSSSGSSSTSTAGTASTGQFQGGYFEGGLYFPVVPKFAQWRFHGQTNGVFVAPMAKLGFQAGDVSVAATDPEKFDVFRFYSFGARIGHFKLYDQPQSEAPQLLSYLDITGGVWDNFRIYPSGTNEVYRRPWRLDATARFKIPLTPLYVGGEVNVGPGPDDMRIFVGTRIDIGKVITTLIPTLK